MGDPKKLKKKYSKPIHPWQKNRIETEKELLKKYGLKNKKEIWKAVSFKKQIADLAKKYVRDTSDQGKKEKIQLLQKLNKYGLLQKTAKLDDVLTIETEDILKRRLQTLVHEKGLSKTSNQARQFITHGHIKISDKKITSPGYVVPSVDESHIEFTVKSTLNDKEHPERAPSKKPKPVKKQEDK
ncbi:30S ribosomal protein S4 [Candidatus Woesearchaeota archaeon]|nr:30S ribosomal protein S4 [Candidatus Woesearchaeota archaeon]